MSFVDSFLGFVGRVATQVAREQLSSSRRRTKRAREDARDRRAPSIDRANYPGDHTGPVTITYAPHAGKLPDPGEVVWTWVPFEEDYSQGKDRPTLIVGREGDWLLGVPLSSKDHELDEAQEAAEGRYWVEVGTGPWDDRGKESTARVNRIIRVDPRRVRRVGGKLDKARFDRVADGIRQHYRS